jgi:uncharacterized protein (DUF433 family)
VGGRYLPPRFLPAKEDSRAGEKLITSDVALSERITIDPEQCGGKPCIRGYRMRVADVLDLLSAGASWEEILADYEFLEREDIQACLDYASARAKHAVVKVS